MSYDISIDVPAHDKRCPHCDGIVERVPAAQLHHWDPTYNYTPMFRAALGGNGIHDWNGKTVAEVAPKLQELVQALLADPAKFSAYDAENGWGSYRALMPFLQERVVPAFREAPPFAIVTVT